MLSKINNKFFEKNNRNLGLRFKIYDETNNIIDIVLNPL